MGIFTAFLDDKDVRLVGVEAAGYGLNTGKHAATLQKGSVGVLHGARTYVLQDENGQVIESHSVSAGLDYPGVGPEHSYYRDTGRATYVAVTDREALDSFHLLARMEGLLPALESAHAVAYAVKLGKKLGRRASMIVCLSGRGDKDVDTVAGLGYGKE